MKFPYVEMRGKLLPIVPVEVKDFEFYAFGEKVFVTVGDGSLIPVYIHKLKIKFASREFETRIGMSKKLGIGFDIIGRKDFFENFKICFDEKNATVEAIEYS